MGITAMVLGIIALVFSVIPVINFLSVILGLVALGLGIVAFIKRKGRGQGIAGAITGGLGLIIAIIAIAFTAAVVESIDQELRDNTSIESEADTEADVSADEGAGSAESPTAEQEDPAGGQEGSRDNPLSLGSTVSTEEWSVTVNDVTFNADEAVAAVNEFNEPAPEGFSYAVINVDVTYNGAESEIPAFGAQVDWVATSGETSSAFDALSVAPEPAFDSSAELFSGGTESGNLVVAIPEENDGLVRVQLGMLATEAFFFSAE